jgi:L-2-hydroxyglutarate oxidase LhgO
VESVEALVVGAGVVGLAVARAIARSGKEVWVVDSESAFGTHTSSRNSEVIHAGLYYAPGSLKAKLCVAGRQQLYDYCASRGVQHRQCGKLIVATEPDQRSALERIAARADAAGAGQLKWLTGEQVRSFEPALRAEEALWSPATGIIDSHGLMRS